jgi:uncharacterized protein (TIGR02145 family)
MPQMYYRKCKNSICLILATALVFASGCEKNENKTKASSSYAVPNAVSAVNEFNGDTLTSALNSSTFVDTRDGKKYKYVKIGKQVWMAENLNYEAKGSRCYGEGGEVYIGDDEKYRSIYAPLSNAEIQANCTNYGRLYNFVTAMAFPDSCSSNACALQNTKYQGICPEGWHIPNSAEWDELLQYVDGVSSVQRSYPYESKTASNHLRTTNGWYRERGYVNSTDKYGFAALPSGFYLSERNIFNLITKYGFWWSAEESNEKYDESTCTRGVDDGCGYDDREDDGEYAYERRMWNNGTVSWDNMIKSNMISVRCVKD